MPPYSTGDRHQMHHLRPQAAEQTDQRQQGAQLLQRMLAAARHGNGVVRHAQGLDIGHGRPSMVATCTS